MDFLEYQDFAVADTITADLPAGDSLPEPMQRLNLSSYIGDDKKSLEDGEFKLPDIVASDKKLSGNVNLYDKMSQYATLSIELLKNETGPTANTTASNASNDDDTFTASTSKATDRKKIAHDLNNMISSSSLDLKNINTKNQVLSKKLSKILNDYNASNYQNTIELKKNLRFLEENGHKIALDKDKLISPEYIGTLSRKTLRSDIENEVLKEHITILEEFRPIIRRIKRFSGPLEKIRQESEAVLTSEENKIADSDKTHALLKDVEVLRSQMELLRIRKQLLISIKDKFTLNQLEDDTIINGTINEEYFYVVNKIFNISQHATYLLALPEERAGASLITKVNEYSGIVNKRLFNYLMDFLYNFESGESSVMGKRFYQDYNTQTFQKALIYLSNDLEYFKEFQSKVTSVRSRSFLEKFLAQFDPNKKSADDIKPIVLSAHDPIRYISDVLASVHALIANEADFIKSLFKFQYEEFADTPKSIIQENSENFLNGMDIKLLNEIVQTIANTCRIRIEQIIRFEDSDTVNFEIVQLLELYQLMFIKKGVAKDNSLIVNLEALRSLSHDKIIASFSKFLDDNVKKIQYTENTDLLPPDWISGYLNKVVDFFELYERKTGSPTDDSEEENKTLDASVLETIISKPFLVTLLKQLQEAFPLARKNEQAKISLLTVEINCFDLIKTRLQPFKTTIFKYVKSDSNLLDTIASKLDEFTTQMKEVQTKFLFENTGLGLYNNLFNMIFPIDSIQDELDYDMYLSLNENPLMQLDTIEKNVHDKLNEYLPHALTNIQENLLFKLTSPSIADDICEDCFAKLAKFYGIFQKLLIHLNPSQEQRVLEILNFSPIEFNMLVGIS